MALPPRTPLGELDRSLEKLKYVKSSVKLIKHQKGLSDVENSSNNNFGKEKVPDKQNKRNSISDDRRLMTRSLSLGNGSLRKSGKCKIAVKSLKQQSKGEKGENKSENNFLNNILALLNKFHIAFFAIMLIIGTLSLFQNFSQMTSSPCNFQKVLSGNSAGRGAPWVYKGHFSSLQITSWLFSWRSYSLVS